MAACTMIVRPSSMMPDASSTQTRPTPPWLLGVLVALAVAASSSLAPAPAVAAAPLLLVDPDLGPELAQTIQALETDASPLAFSAAGADAACAPKAPAVPRLALLAREPSGSM